MVIKHGGLSTQRDCNVFQYCATKYIQLLTTPEATSEFRDLSFVFGLGFDEPWVMHAALAPAALHASYSELVPKEAAISYSQSALHGLRRAIQTRFRDNTISRDMVLAASLYLGVFEDFYSAPSSHSLVHYKAISQVLEEWMANVHRLQLAEMSVFHLTLLDSVLYHFSTRLIFEPEIDAIWTSFPWNALAKYVEAWDDESRDPRTTPRVLPVVGKTPPTLFFLISQITWLSRQLASSSHTTSDLARQCQTTLEEIEEAHFRLHGKCSAVLQDGAIKPVISNGDIAAELYFLALRIYIGKVLDPQKTRTDSAAIHLSLINGFALLNGYDASEPCSQVICWPLIILGCAACPLNLAEARGQGTDSIYTQTRMQMRRLIREKLLEIWQLSLSGFVRRTANCLDKVWNLHSSLHRFQSSTDDRFRSKYSSLSEKYDGLSALVSKKGLASLQD